MENIFHPWTRFNKAQNRYLKGEQAFAYLELAEKNSQQWNATSYPKGEAWKYVSFQNLPSTELKMNKNESTNKQSASEDYYCFEIQNFSEPSAIDLGALPSGLKVRTHLEEMGQEANTLLQSSFAKTDKENPFSQSALSFYGLGLVFVIDESCKINKPIKIIFNLDSIQDKDQLAVFNVSVIGKKACQAQFLIETRASSFSGLANFRLDFDLAEKADIQIYNKEKSGPQSYVVYNFNGQINAKACLRHFDLTLPGSWSRHNVTTDLYEKGAHVELLGAYLNKENYFCDHHTEIRHLVGSTTSKEDYRGVLADEAKAVFNGKVFIEEKASQSSSEQINKNLVLSKKAEVNTKPELQIYNDDVKAAHGATVGQLDEEQRFYLQSRGYNPSQAFQVLSRAFVFDLIEETSDEAKVFLSQDLQEALAEMKES